MNLHSRTSGRAIALLALGLAACSGGKGGGDLFIESCSLGCSSGVSGTQVFCSVVNTFVNQDFTVLFSEAIDPASINSSTFRIVDTSNGSTPLGDAFVDPANPRRLIFKPALTFDEVGNPSFGFASDTAYQFQIPGAAQDDGPYLKSTAGRVNQSRLECTVLTDQGIIDPVAGPPTVEVLVTAVTATDADGNPTAFEEIALSESTVPALPIWRFSPIEMRFNEPMNPATLLDPASGTSSTIHVSVDIDGDLGTGADRVPVSGRFDLDLDLEQGLTILTFLHEVPNPSGEGFIMTTGFPSAGDDPDNPRLVTLLFTNNVADIVGLKLVDDADGALYAFQPEAIPQPPIILPGGVVDDGDPFENGAETFTWSNSSLAPPPAGETSLEDAERSGALWGNGRLARGVGGGSGRLGELLIGAGETVVLDTDSQTFPLAGDVIDLLANPDMLGDYPETITVTDGVFEFSKLEILGGGMLILQGSNPARIFVRGPASISSNALVDLSGGSAPAHDSRHPDPRETWVSQVGNFLADPVVPGQGTVGGSDGGFGGARHLFTDADITQEGGANSTQLPSWVLNDTNGRLGDPVAGEGETSGGGGSRYPDVFPTGEAWANSQDMGLNLIPWPALGEDGCFNQMAGGTGSGGGYATNGIDGVAASPIPTYEFPAETPPGSNNAPDTPAGQRIAEFLPGGSEEPSFTNTGYDMRTLSPTDGWLRGGSGGGGGGCHPFLTFYDGWQEGFPTPNCEAGVSSIDSGVLLGGETAWADHSGASGGGGGGAIQICSGVSIELDGVIDATGGNGGSNLVTSPSGRQGRWAMPGGGGSGGAVLLQARTVELSPSPGRIDVRGGNGGQTTLGTTTAGAGGAGLVRIEATEGGPVDASGADHDAVDHSIQPFDGTAPFTYGEFSVDFVSVGPDEWDPPAELPESYSAAVSCWIKPPGNFVNINFSEDPAGATDPDDFGWNMHVIWSEDGTGPEQMIPFRGDNGGVLVDSFENVYGNNLNHDLVPGERSPIAVRFQAARVVGELTDPCATGLAAPIDTTSLTPWVQHSFELNPAPGSGDVSPDVFRFVILFDRSAPDIEGPTAPIRGVTNFWVRADPN